MKQRYDKKLTDYLEVGEKREKKLVMNMMYTFSFTQPNMEKQVVEK